LIACVDGDYRPDGALAALVGCRDWTDATPVVELTECIAHVEPYEPGQFYKRELPCLLAVLRRLPEPLNLVVVDGFVWLGDETRPGLGAHLHRAFGGTVPVVGVAKNPFAGAVLARPVQRGTGRKPLWVTAVGVDVDRAADAVRSMHGPYRVPTLLRRVDQLCRQTPLALAGLAATP
jgi:deoxyribonuclease V